MARNQGGSRTHDANTVHRLVAIDCLAPDAVPDGYLTLNEVFERLYHLQCGDWHIRIQEPSRLVDARDVFKDQAPTAH